MNATSTIRTLVADDEPLARKGIRVWLESERDINIIGEATDGEEAAETIRELKPDLVFLDVRMPGIDGFEKEMTAEFCKSKVNFRLYKYRSAAYFRRDGDGSR
jgi:YesN/AraC family two-component response regulator